MSVVESIGELIRRERLERDMTQRDLANRVDVGVPYISKIEAGRERPSDDVLRRVAEVFGQNVDEFLLAARRLPDDLMDRFASDPKAALEYLRKWRTSGS